MSFSDLYPWQLVDWTRVYETLDRLPHATLVEATKGVGIDRLMEWFAAAILCDSNSIKPCGECRNCTLYLAGNHPDFHLITTEKQTKEMNFPFSQYALRYDPDGGKTSTRKHLRNTIAISQIREMIDAAVTKSHISDNKVFLIYPVESMTVSAANSMLKILEEPADQTFLLLVSTNVQNLLPTIISRCQRLNIHGPSEQQSTDWLIKRGYEKSLVEIALAFHPRQPLTCAYAIDQNDVTQFDDVMRRTLGVFTESGVDVVALAESGKKLGESDFLIRLHQLVCDLIRMRMNVNIDKITYSYLSDNMSAVCQKLNIDKLYRALDHIANLNHEISDGALDRNLAIEDALLSIREASEVRPH